VEGDGLVFSSPVYVHHVGVVGRLVLLVGNLNPPEYGREKEIGRRSCTPGRCRYKVFS